MAGEGLNSGLDYDSAIQQALGESRSDWQRADQGRIERAMHVSCGTAEDDELIRTIQDISLQDFEEEESLRSNAEIFESQGREAPQVEFTVTRSSFLRSGNAYQSSYASGNQPSSVPLSMRFMSELPAQSILNEEDTELDFAIALSLQTQYGGDGGRQTRGRSSPLSRSDSRFSRDSGYESLSRTSIIRGPRFNGHVFSGASSSAPSPEARNQFHHQGDIYNINNYYVDGKLSTHEVKKQSRVHVPRSAARDGLYQRQSSDGSAQTSKPERASSKKGLLDNVLKKLHLQKTDKDRSIPERGGDAEPIVRQGHGRSLSDSVSQWVHDLPGGWKSDTASEYSTPSESDGRSEHARSPAAVPTTISDDSTYYTALDEKINPLLRNDLVRNGGHGHPSPTRQVSTVSHTYDVAPAMHRSVSVASSRPSPVLEMPGRWIHTPHPTQVTDDGSIFEREESPQSPAAIPHPQEIRERLLQVRGRSQSQKPSIALGKPPRPPNMQSAVPNGSFPGSQTSMAVLPPTPARMDYEAGRQHPYVPLRTDLANLVPPPGQNLRNWNTHGTRDLDRHGGGGHIPLQGVNLPSLPRDRRRKESCAPLRGSETSSTRAKRVEKDRQKDLRWRE